MRGGKWADIKKLNLPAIDARSAVDLKDKWRNLTRLVTLPSALPRALARPDGATRRLPGPLLCPPADASAPPGVPLLASLVTLPGQRLFLGAKKKGYPVR